MGCEVWTLELLLVLSVRRLLDTSLVSNGRIFASASIVSDSTPVTDMLRSPLVSSDTAETSLKVRVSLLIKPATLVLVESGALIAVEPEAMVLVAPGALVAVPPIELPLQAATNSRAPKGSRRRATFDGLDILFGLHSLRSVLDFFGEFTKDWAARTHAAMTVKVSNKPFRFEFQDRRLIVAPRSALYCHPLESTTFAGKRFSLFGIRERCGNRRWMCGCNILQQFASAVL